MENVDLLSPTAPSLVFAREPYTPYTAVGIDGLRQDFRFVFADPVPAAGGGTERAALPVQVVRQGLPGAALRDTAHGAAQGAAPDVFLLRAPLPLGDESAQPPHQLLPAHERDDGAAPRGRGWRRGARSVAEVDGSRPGWTDVVVPCYVAWRLTRLKALIHYQAIVYGSDLTGTLL